MVITNGRIDKKENPESKVFVTSMDKIPEGALSKTINREDAQNLLKSNISPKAKRTAREWGTQIKQTVQDNKE
jgi:hypothetical protein